METDTLPTQTSVPNRTCQRPTLLQRVLKFLKWTGLILVLFVATLSAIAAIWNISATRRLNRALTEARTVGPFDPTELADLCDRDLEGQTNAAPYYEAAFALLDSCARNDVRTNLPMIGGQRQMPELGKRLPEQDLTNIENYFQDDQIRLAFALIDKASQIDRCVFTITFHEDLKREQPFLPRHAARFFRLRCSVACARTNATEATVLCKQSLRLAGSLRNDPMLTSHLFRIGTLSLALGQIEEVLTTLPLSPRQLEDIATALREQTFGRETTVALLDERNDCSLTIEKGLAGEDSDLLPWSQSRVVYIGGYSPLRYRGHGCLRHIRLWFASGLIKSQYAEYLELSSRAIRRMGNSASRRVAADLSTEMRTLVRRSKPTWRDSVVKGCIHPLSKVLEMTCCTQQRLDAAILATAIERYRLAHQGELPAKLDDLAPTYIAAIPDDYFGEGKIRLRKLEKGYVLYGVGPNGKDDGGQQPTYDGGGDITFRVLR